MSEPVLTICICTHRRTAWLIACLQSLANQEPNTPFCVLVVDNDADDTARSQVLRAAVEFGLQLRYVHAPAHNIALARNAALDLCDTDLLVFFDDDQQAEPGWLQHLLQGLGDADAVFGPVLPIYRSTEPEWLQQGRFHQKQARSAPDGTLVGYGYTANVLLRRDRLPGLRFDLQSGPTGGEDTRFFHQWASLCARFVVADLAIASEEIAPERCTMQWLTKRHVASGHVHADLIRQDGRSLAWAFLSAGLKYLYCQIAAALTCYRPVRWRAWRLRGALHYGVMAALLGARAPALYGQEA
ncbi:glycosyltransferase family 2 protein [Ahniella affigens]|uniref:glycosyltransferase family 2 protein n=1 Tax=Ahniella affigens TaxID=2021234 RepID=UPI0014743E5E|nr:glycosyltransferase family 2 protein [Ahniella affigens]